MRMRCFWIRVDGGGASEREAGILVTRRERGGMTTGRLQSSNVAEGSQNRVTLREGNTIVAVRRQSRVQEEEPRGAISMRRLMRLSLYQA
jgi:hypothetical protein